MTSAAIRHDAGVATYPGNVQHIVGEVKGPLTYGGHVAAVEADYDPTTDTTRVTFAHVTAGEAHRDEFGITRIVQ